MKILFHKFKFPITDMVVRDILDFLFLESDNNLVADDDGGKGTARVKLLDILNDGFALVAFEQISGRQQARVARGFAIGG